MYSPFVGYACSLPLSLPLGSALWGFCVVGTVWLSPASLSAGLGFRAPVVGFLPPLCCATSIDFVICVRVPSGPLLRFFWFLTVCLAQVSRTFFLVGDFPWFGFVVSLLPPVAVSPVRVPLGPVFPCLRAYTPL